MKRLLLFSLCIISLHTANAQNSKSAYPSLLWEITGNGLTQPSYLFGTMHVSNKMVFHLSDSFYNAIASCSAVSLELDPRQWQSEMFRLQQSQMAMGAYLRMPNDYIRERSFRIGSDYAKNIGRALSEEPYVINGLLYRTAEGQSNFQENTYLDLYVYQTARKLGKRATGVENYLESEKIQLEAQEDMMRSRNRTRISFPTENPYEIQRKIQEAYRRGDLSMLDSLSQLSGNNEAFNEKFLYGRNDIQANSIDSIIRKESLFVAVGAAHLPGKRGVIEILRRKGYNLRPVNMTDKDAGQRERIDKIRVPVQMQTVTSDDGFIELKVPGKFFKRGDYSFTESWQYADMENGAYYMLSRIRTNPAQTGETMADVIRKTDSLLYENIPGKILDKKTIEVDGYKGLSIVNKTRRGDIQRYAIVYTPAEVLVFKMSGNDEYVYGKEADDFFGSIHLLHPQTGSWASFSPSTGGFTVTMPQRPVISDNTDESMIAGWQYEAIDPATGDGYTITRKSIHNYAFIEEDTFDISLIAESLKSSDIVDKELSRKFGKQDGLTSLDVLYSLKDGGVLKARAFIRGAQYYLLTAKSKDVKNNFNRFFNSFRLTDTRYTSSRLYTDSALGFTVMTPVQPAVDKDLQDFLNKQQFGMMSIILNERYQPRPFPRNAFFRSDSTGEAIHVAVSTFPKYYSQTDTVRFWDTEMDWKRLSGNMVIDEKKFAVMDSMLVCRYVLSDTNTDRRIRGMAILSANRLYRIQTITDNSGKESGFVRDFYSSFRPINDAGGVSVFSSKSGQLLSDIASSDSAVQKLARTAINAVSFEGKDFSRMKEAFNTIEPGSRDYLSAKTRLIQATGQIKDTVQQQERLHWLASLYNTYADTSLYQNAALQAIVAMKTAAAFDTLKNILVLNPPVFDNNLEYTMLFNRLDDSLSLAARLYPELLRLTAFDDFKQPVFALLAKLVDSSRISPDSYRAQLPGLLFDLQVQARKLQAVGEREMLRSSLAETERGMDMYTPNIPNNAASSLVNNYLVLLAPYYDENPQVAKLFTRLLNGNDMATRLNASMLLVRNGKPVTDTIWQHIAANDTYRVPLYERLEKAGKAELFPAKYKTQEAFSRSQVVNVRQYARVVEIEPMGSEWVQTKKKNGYAYFFKYRLQKQGDWLMAISGVQPADTAQVSTDKSLAAIATRKLVTNGTEREQYSKMLKQQVMAQRRSAILFFQPTQAGMEGMLF